MPRWHTDYQREDELWLVSCPYCKATTRKGLLSEALKAGVEHEARCTARNGVES